MIRAWDGYFGADMIRKMICIKGGATESTEGSGINAAALEEGG